MSAGIEWRLGSFADIQGQLQPLRKTKNPKRNPPEEPETKKELDKYPKPMKNLSEAELAQYSMCVLLKLGDPVPRDQLASGF